MKKKLLSMVLCGMMVLSVVGCGKSKSANRLEEVRENKVLKVALSPDYAPYEFEDPSKSGADTYVGADVEFAKYLASELGVELEIVAMDFDACVASVAQGKVDCSISALYPSEERKKTVDFTEPYYDDSDQLVVISKENAEAYQTTEDFAGEVIAAQNGSAQADVAAEQIPDAKLQLVNKATDGIQMVKSGKAAGILLQGVMAQSVVDSDDSLAICPAKYTYADSELVVAVGKGETELVEEMNKIIQKVNDEKLYDQWIVDAQYLAAEITSEE